MQTNSANGMQTFDKILKEKVVSGILDAKVAQPYMSEKINYLS